MADVTMSLEEYEAIRRLIGIQDHEMEILAGRRESDAPEIPKKKRRVSKYQREFGRQMKKLKATHPRTPVTKLMSKGHSATRKALGMKQKRRSR